ncbi:MAG: hypothetical protein IKC69_03940 [Clostridia bacterium]|nr:hypothetical protein [Clostridia bacterium]
MKRILALILCLTMLLPLASCTQTPEKTKATEPAAVEKTEQKTTEPTAEETETEKAPAVEYNHVVNDPLTWDDVNAIPIANSSMSTEELRDICVRFFDLSMTFTWIPDRDYNYVVESQNFARVLEKGKLTGGIPYITIGYGNLYRIMDSYDSETGILNMSRFMVEPKVLGNACSGGATMGWARCINSIPRFQWTWGMTHANGFLKVGPYEYDLTLTEIGREKDDYGAPEIVASNGEQVMFESYAATHKADGIVNTGHVRMISDEPIVVRNADGTINGKESYLICHDQICYNTNEEKYGRVQSDGTQYHIAGGNSWKYSFAELFSTCYIPFTFAEFLGTDPVEDAAVAFTHTAEGATVHELSVSTVSANYLVLDFYIKVKDGDGKEVFRYSKNNNGFLKNDMALKGAIPSSALQKFADGSHTVELSVQLGNGLRPVFYTGILKAE